VTRGLLPLACLTALLSAWLAAAAMSADGINAFHEYVNRYALPMAMATWVEFDARRRGKLPCFDFGWLTFVFWRIAIPVYLVRTRGARGLVQALLFGLMLLIPGVVAAMAAEVAVLLRAAARLFF